MTTRTQFKPGEAVLIRTPQGILAGEYEGPALSQDHVWVAFEDWPPKSVFLWLRPEETRIGEARADGSLQCSMAVDEEHVQAYR